MHVYSTTRSAEKQDRRGWKGAGGGGGGGGGAGVSRVRYPGPQGGTPNNGMLLSNEDVYQIVLHKIWKIPLQIFQEVIVQLYVLLSTTPKM